ncbi:MAG TPA: hypothetical protein VJK30_04440 [Coxiellaceae bacterium]|nr:MAG: hypothetical protein A3E81_07540 [Gammaproteobacteria bacterium RIFCSPHIGHO2_12_FULL_36_30]HLB56558.1 hypothetical protein [Coxiellaceae bacterium]
MLEFVARKLENLNNDVVYLGGCATALFITDPLSLDVRPTIDVDCIIDVASLLQYHKFEKELNKKGFKKTIKDDVICRWRYDDIILDVMPTDEKILGFGNPWYKQALQHSVNHLIHDNLIVKSVTAPYFLATKIEAFKTRGNNDFLMSHDFEDMITVIAGRVEIAEEVAMCNREIKAHLGRVFSDILKNDQFEVALPGHLNNGSVSMIMERVQIVKKRIEKIVVMRNG